MSPRSGRTAAATAWAWALSRRTAWALWIGIALRLGVVATSPWTPTGGDADAYLHVAHWIRDHGEMPAERGLPAVLPPLYPCIAAVLSLAGDREGVLGLKLLNVAGGGVAIVLAGRLGRRLAGRRRGGLAAWITALHPMLVLYTRDVTTECLFLPLLLGGLLLTARVAERARASGAVAFGTLLGASALLRPAGLAPGAAAYVVAVLSARGPRVPRKVGLALAAGTACLLTIAPWALYASARFGERILLTDTAGFNFWDGHHPLNYQVAKEEDQQARDRLAARKDRERRALVAACAADGCTRAERSERFRRDAWARMEEGGASLAWHTLANLRSVWKLAPDAVAHGRVRSVALALFEGPLTVVGLLGILGSCRRRRSRPLGLAAVTSLLVFTVTAAWFVGTFRYRFGHVDPFLAVWAPVAFRARAACLRSPRRRAAPAGGRSRGREPR